MSEASGPHITARDSLYRRGQSRGQRGDINNVYLMFMELERHIQRRTVFRRGIRVNYIPGRRLQKHQEHFKEQLEG